MSTQFKRQTDLKRSSGLRLSTPVRSLVERVADSAGLTYSDAIRLLVEEALAARAGERDNLAGRITRAEKAIVENLRGQAQALSTIEQEALVAIRKQTDWIDPLVERVNRTEQKVDAMQWQIEKVLDLLAEKVAE